jgi:hypothetical protein
MIRRLYELLFGARPTSSSAKDDRPSSTSSASPAEDEGVGPVDPLDPLKRDEDLPGLDPVVDPVPPET